MPSWSKKRWSRDHLPAPSSLSGIGTSRATNNHFRGQAPANALQIMARLADRKVPLPPPLAEAFPDLLADGAVQEDEGTLL